MPLYPLYALFFADTGLSTAEISALFAIWSAVGVVAEVPSGMLADRYSRRAAIVASGVVQAVGFALWATLPGFWGFAVGFVCWAVGGSLSSGALEALLYDGLADAGAAGAFGRVYARVSAAEQLADLPTAVAATVLYAQGGYPLVAWASVATSLAGSALALRLPERPRVAAGSRDGDGRDAGDGLLAVLRASVRSLTKPGVLAAVLAVTIIGGADGLEEYFPLLAQGWGIPAAAVPAAMLAISVAGAAGAALGGRATRLPASAAGALFGAGSLALWFAGVWASIGGLAVITGFHLLHQLVLVVVETRLQQQIDGPARATVTSTAALGTELGAIAVFGLWAVGALPLVAGVFVVVGGLLPFLLRPVRR